MKSKKTNLTYEKKKKLEALINAALERYSLEQLFSEFLEFITDWKDRESIAELIVNDDDLKSDVIDKLENTHVVIEKERESYYEVVEIKNLSQQIRFEQFQEELNANPYQLKLIA